MVAFANVVRRSTPDDLQRVASLFDEGEWSMLAVTIAAALASLVAFVAELARVHGAPYAGWTEALAGATVILSWYFIHTIFATHYAHEFWREGLGLSFPGNAQRGYSEFVIFRFPNRRSPNHACEAAKFRNQ